MDPALEIIADALKVSPGNLNVGSDTTITDHNTQEFKTLKNRTYFLSLILIVIYFLTF